MFQDMLNTITLGNSYELIKEIPDNSIDCIYVDIPYLYNINNKIDSLKKVGLAARISKVMNNDLSGITDGIDYKILDEFIRIRKKNQLFYLV